MPDNDTNNNGFPTNNGFHQQNDLASILTTNLDRNFSSFETQLKNLIDFLKRGDTSKKSASSRDTKKELEKELKSLTNNLEVFGKKMNSVTKQAQKASDDWKNQSESLQKEDITKALASYRQRLLDAFKSQVEAEETAVKQKVDSYKTEIDTLKSSMNQAQTSLDNALSALQDSQKDLDTANSAYMEAEKKAAEAKEKALKTQNQADIDAANIAKQQSDIAKQIFEQQKTIVEQDQALVDTKRDTLENYNKNVKKLEEKIEKEQKAYDSKVEKKQEELNKAIEDIERKSSKIAYSVSKEVLSQSSFLNEKFKSDEEKEAEKDPFFEKRKAIDQEIKNLEKAIQTIESEIIKTQDEDLKKNLITQKKILENNRKAMVEWTPLKDSLTGAGKNLKTAAKELVDSIPKKIFDRLNDYYLDAFKEGFDRVYSSIENTRNEISARLRLSQGDYSELQESIQEEIESRNLENTITQSDVNEALVSLQGAGITDVDILKELALTGAELKASGSSLQLGNEETLQNIMKQISKEMQGGATKEEALQTVTGGLRDISAAETVIRETYGSDMALVGGNLNTMYNDVMSRADAIGKSFSDGLSDLFSTMDASQQLFNQNLDPQIISSMIKDFQEKGTNELSNIEKSILTNLSENRGLNKEGLLGLSAEEQINIISQALSKVYSGIDTNYISEISTSFGTGLTGQQARIMAQKEGEIVNVNSESIQEQISLAKEQNDLALENADYLSATKKHQNETENTMTEIAIGAEKIYNGNKIVQDGFEGVTTILTTIEGSILDIAKSGWNTFLHGGASGGPGGSGGGLLNANLGTNAKDFMLGTRGTTAGNIGRVAGTAVGVGMVGYSVYENITNQPESADAGDVAIDIFSDPTTWSGIGTAVGSAVGGPIAGAIVGGLMGIGANIGDWLGDKAFSGKDALGRLVDEYKKESSERLENDTKELNELQNTLSRYKSVAEKQDTAAMKQILLEEANINAADLKNKTDEEIQELFQNNLVDQKENLAKEKELQVGMDSIINKNAQVTSYMGQDFTGSAFGQYGKNFDELTEEERDDYIKTNLASFQGTGKAFLSDVTKQMKEVESLSGDSLNEYLYTLGVSPDQVKAMGDDDSKKIEKAQSVYLENIKSQSGFTDETAALFDEAMAQYNRRKSIYESSEAEFQERWSRARDSVISENNLGDKEPDIGDVMIKYIDLYHHGGTWGDEERGIQIDYETGEAHLIPGDMYKDSYSFKTGITNVPYDNYPAMLHKGERVLTAEESISYNDLSSYSLQQLKNNLSSNISNKDYALDYDYSDSTESKALISYITRQMEENNYSNSSSNVLSTNSYGISNFDKTINNQTNSLVDILKQILIAIQSISISGTNVSRISNAHKNVLRGNSNITQLNTM